MLIKNPNISEYLNLQRKGVRLKWKHEIDPFITFISKKKYILYNRINF